MAFLSFEGVKKDGNGSFDIIGPVTGMLEAIVISDDADSSNAAKTVSIVAVVAEALTVTFGAPTIVGNTPTVIHPRRLINNAADFSTIAANYDRYYLNGKVTVTVASGDANDITRVRLVVEQ